MSSHVWSVNAKSILQNFFIPFTYLEKNLIDRFLYYYANVCGAGCPILLEMKFNIFKVFLNALHNNLL